ncbi:MAG: hypothetical protein EBT79_12740 [Actinobacteria bacterium]|nr:hypothetical protein [Actinomycetota bacterium]NBR68112.1 hypothetical protein [Actinomycetota bacterium]
MSDELEQLRAENRRLRDVLRWTNNTISQYAQHSTPSEAMASAIAGVRAEIERLWAEIERLRAECIELNSALSRIDYACGEPNEMGCSEYDVHADPEVVVRRVTERLAQRHTPHCTNKEM